MKALAAYIVSGRWQAILAASISGALTVLVPPFGSMLNYLAAAIVALVTLHIGILPGLQVMAMAAAVTLLLYQLVGVQAVVALVMILMLWLPCWIAATVLQQTSNLGQSFKAAVLFGVCLLLLVFSFYGDPAAWWMEQLQLVEATLAEAGLSFPALMDEQLLQEVSALMTGVVIASLVIGVLASLLLARWWQSVLVHPGAFREEFYGLRLGVTNGLITLGIMLLARFMQGAVSDFGAQLAMIMLVPYLLAGLAVIHCLLYRAGRGRGWLIGIYVLLAFVPQATLLLAAGGLVDTWVDFRRRLARDEDNTD
jgi:hypothetical protein